MIVPLEGKCFVTGMFDGVSAENASAQMWNLIGRATGADAISLRVLKFAEGISPKIHNAESDELFYVLEGNARLSFDGREIKAGPETGIYLRPGQTLIINNEGPAPFVLISSRCPEPLDALDAAAVNLLPRADTDPQTFVARLAEQKSLPTGDRWYRVLVDDEMGSHATQFVGSIPPGRAPDHFHEYEEVIVILRGQGRMWAGESNTEIGPGSCIYLPRRQVHCLENLGTDELRVLGVFYPAGSPAVRYDVAQ